jgi:tetratricopeptide (TPR) repeat protein
LGNLLKPTRRKAEGEVFYKQAVALQEQLADQYPTVTAYRRELARTYQNLAQLLWESGKRQAAYETFQKGVDRLQRLALDFPAVPEYRHELATSYSTWGEVLRVSGSPGSPLAPKTSADVLTKAEASFRTALPILTSLVTEFPNRPSFRLEQAMVLLSQGKVLADSRQPGAAEKTYHESLAICMELVRQFPDEHEYSHALTHVQLWLAVLLFERGQRLGEPTRGAALLLFGGPTGPLGLTGLVVGVRGVRAEALRLLQRAVVYQRKACDAHPDNLEYRKQLCDLYYALANLHRRLKDHQAVAQAAVELPRVAPDDSTEYVIAAEFLAWAARLARLDGRLPEDRRKQVVEGYVLQMISLLQEAVQKGYKNLQQLETNLAFAPFRDRPDFKKILESLRSKAGVGVA